MIQIASVSRDRSYALRLPKPFVVWVDKHSKISLRAAEYNVQEKIAWAPVELAAVERAVHSGAERAKPPCNISKSM